MPLPQALRGWSAEQKSVVLASFLGWMLDAFDFFLLIFVLKDVAASFGVTLTRMSAVITITLAMRPVGAFLFGRAADRFGRRPVMMINILVYSLLAFCSGFAPSLGVLLVLRAIFGIAMGGEWGVGSSLTMESVPVHARGLVSGMLQAGYPCGYLLAAVAYGLLFPHIGWRGLFMVGALPALLVVYVRRKVPESPGWSEQPAHEGGTLAVLRRHWQLAIYCVLLMTSFNFFSHGTQDVYPTFLREQHHLSPQTVSLIAVVYNIGAMLGGLCFGSLSERIGRRRAIVLACLLALPVLPLWMLAGTPLWLATGAFLMQFMVQGAWGVIPAHLNELSPAEARATFPGFVYQLGNLLSSINATLQVYLASNVLHGDYAMALGLVTGTVAIVIALLTGFGVEAKGVNMAKAAD